MQDIGFDVISDLNLHPGEYFNWEGKSTSLYCLVAGNVSNDLITVVATLGHLARFYQGVFYVPGALEYENALTIVSRTKELLNLTKSLPNVCMLHQHVAIIDGVAVVGINGWNEVGDSLTLDNLLPAAARHEDITYLQKAVSKLQKHLDVKKIVVVTNAVPNPSLYFGQAPQIVEDQIPLHVILDSDTEHKITQWVFGSYDRSVDKTINNVNYVSNPYQSDMPYWAKRLTILV